MYTIEQTTVNKFADTFSEISSTENYSEVFKREKITAEIKTIAFRNSNSEDYNSAFGRNELKSAINKLKMNTAREPDLIHNCMIKELPERTIEFIFKNI